MGAGSSSEATPWPEAAATRPPSRRLAAAGRKRHFSEEASSPPPPASRGRQASEAAQAVPDAGELRTPSPTLTLSCSLCGVMEDFLSAGGR